MLDLIVNTDSGELAELLARLSGEVKSKDLIEDVSEAAADATREHLRGLSAKRHRGVTAKSFYLRAADSVVADYSGDDARVEIPHTGLALRYYGGRVEPSGKVSLITGKPIRHLAIPRKGSEAEGKTPYDFKGQDLELGFGKKSLYLGKPEGDGKKLTPLFWLVEKSDHEADKSVLPSDDTLADAAEAAIDEHIQEIIHGR